MSHSIGALGLVAVFALQSCSGGHTEPSPLQVSFNEVAKIQAYPVPEGSAPPPLVQVDANSPGDFGRPIGLVKTDIPSPFPAPQQCEYSGPGSGLKLSVWLVDGRRLDYFACAFPEALDTLYNHAF